MINGACPINSYFHIKTGVCGSIFIIRKYCFCIIGLKQGNSHFLTKCMFYDSVTFSDLGSCGEICEVGPMVSSLLNTCAYWTSGAFKALIIEKGLEDFPTLGVLLIGTSSSELRIPSRLIYLRLSFHWASESTHSGESQDLSLVTKWVQIPSLYWVAVCT